jgi:hypothetical protein
MDTGTCDDVTKEGKLGDTAVLDFDISKTVESLLVGIVKEAKRIEETKRSLCAKLRLEGIE